MFYTGPATWLDEGANGSRVLSAVRWDWVGF